MDLVELLKQLEDASNPSRRKVLLKQGAQDNAMGVPLGFLRTLAKQLGQDHDMGLELWNTQIVDAQILAVMLLDSDQVQIKDAIEMIKTAQTEPLREDLLFRCLVKIKDQDKFRASLLALDEDVFEKAYWCCIVEDLKQKPVDPALANMVLKTCQERLVQAAPLTQWMMNRALSELGFRHSEYTDTCIALGEKLGVYQDMVVAKGCTSAYAPAWISAVIKK